MKITSNSMTVHHAARTKANNILGVWLLILLVASPLPLGSTSPILLAAFGGVAGLTLVTYSLAVGVSWPASLGPGRAGLLPCAWLGVCAYAVIQALPIGGISFFNREGEIVQSVRLSLAAAQTVLSAVQMMGYGAIFILMWHISIRESRGILLLQVLFWSGVSYAVLSLFQLTQWGDTILGFSKWAYEGSATGTFVNRNSFATFLSLTLTVGFALAVQRVELGRRSRNTPVVVTLAIAAGLIVVLAALIATQSRMGLFSGLLGALTIVLLWLGKARRFGAVIAVAVAGSIALSLLLLLFGGALLERLGGVEDSLDQRLGLYSQIWDMIVARPLLGYGGGSFELAFQLFHAPPVSGDYVWVRAHSTYLALWVEFGVIFGSLPILCVGFIALKILTSYLHRRELRSASLAALGGTVVVAVHSVVDFSLEIQSVALLFAGILAVGLAAAPGRSRSGSP